MATTRREMPKRRKERQRETPKASMPPPAPKGKVGTAGKTHIARRKEPLKPTRKVEG